VLAAIEDDNLRFDVLKEMATDHLAESELIALCERREAG
jgi:hypothetical protein